MSYDSHLDYLAGEEVTGCFVLRPLLRFVTVPLCICVSLSCFKDEVEDPMRADHILNV